jgi:hypothetical protein
MARISEHREVFNTSSGKPAPAPDTKESKQRVIQNKPNGPFPRISENKARRRG